MPTTDWLPSEADSLRALSKRAETPAVKTHSSWSQFGSKVLIQNSETAAKLSGDLSGKHRTPVFVRARKREIILGFASLCDYQSPTGGGLAGPAAESVKAY